MARPLREELFFCCFPLSICWNDSRKGRRKEGIKTKKRKEKEMRKKGIEEWMNLWIYSLLSHCSNNITIGEHKWFKDMYWIELVFFYMFHFAKKKIWFFLLFSTISRILELIDGGRGLRSGRIIYENDYAESLVTYCVLK